MDSRVDFLNKDLGDLNAEIHQAEIAELKEKYEKEIAILK